MSHELEARVTAAVDRISAREAHVPAGLPSFARVAEILDDARLLLFPDFFDAAQELRARAAHFVDRVEHEIRLAAPEKDARELAVALLEALPGIRAVLDEDAQAAVHRDPAAKSLAEVVLAYPSIRALVAHRTARFLCKRGVPLLPRMLSEHAHQRTGIDIHPAATIGPGLFIDHGTGVVIGETAVVGRNCTLYQGVTLGALTPNRETTSHWSDAKRHPTLEDRVTVYANATILGGTTVVGEGSIVGASVWLTQSVPPNSRVLPAPMPPVLRTAHPPLALEYQI